MTATVRPPDQVRRRAALRPLVMLAVAFAVVAGLFASGQSPASANTAVTSMTVDRFGTRLGATIMINESRKIMVHVGDTRLPDNQPDYVSAGMTTRVVDHYTSPQATKQMYRTFTNMAPARLYWLQVYVQNPDGFWTQVVRNRAELTKSRMVRVHWDRVQIINDGDPMGCGELTIKAKVENRWGSQPHAMSPSFSGCGGQIVNMNWTSPWITQNGSSLSIYTAVQDDDTPFGTMCRSGWGGCGDFAQGTKSLPLPNEPNEGYSKDFIFLLDGVPSIAWYGRYVTTYV